MAPTHPFHTFNSGRKTTDARRKTAESRRKNTFSHRILAMAKQQKTRLYILRRCITMLLCWHAHSLHD
ncbi:hypothetical protein AMTRI_Chr05g64490 [Amborella trichopoda]